MDDLPIHKGCGNVLEPYKVIWNFIWSSTCIFVERIFGILKGGWKIIMWQTNVPVWSMAKLASICIVLDNICKLQKDIFDTKLIIEAKIQLQKKEEIDELKGG